ncbi:MAG: protein O-mannosyl-transferase family [Rudaea sp.]
MASLTSNRASRGLALLAALLALSVYLRTLAPTITWKHDGADSGDLASAAFTFGIPHPPGYPLFTPLAGLFAHLPAFEPASGIGLMVALAAAAAVYVLARAGCGLLSPFRSIPATVILPPVAALGFAFAPAIWSKATIVEVYTLNLLFASIVLWAIVSDHPRRVPIAALAFGLGLAHHLTIALLLPGALVALSPGRRDLKWLPLLVAPLLFYLYLPLRARADPPVNWGDPRSLDGFLWVVTAGPYRGYLLAEGASDVVARIAYTARLLFEQFTAPGIAVALWGMARLFDARRRLWGGLALAALALTFYSIAYAAKDSFEYLIPVYAIVLLWLVYGAADVMSQFARPAVQYVLAGLVLLLPVFNLLAHFPAMDLSSDREAFNYAEQAIGSAPSGAVLFADGDQAVFALTYYRYVSEAGRSNVLILSPTLLDLDWYYLEQARRLPDLALPAATALSGGVKREEEIAKAAFAAGRPVCFDRSSPLLSEFDYDPEGSLQCAISTGE